jgi:hypothetical protein
MEGYSIVVRHGSPGQPVLRAAVVGAVQEMSLLIGWS